MQNEFNESGEEQNMTEALEEQLAYINETIQESENEDSTSSENSEKLPSETNNQQEDAKEMQNDREDSESDIERRECDCCKIIPDEIINMNCIHNICVNCTLSVSKTQNRTHSGPIYKNHI